MGIQEIIAGLLVLAAIAYLGRYFYLQTKSHNCDDCGLMQMKKEGKIKS